MIALPAADGVVEELAALCDGARDLLEGVRTLVREVHEDDRLAGSRVEVLTRAGELQVLAGHLRDVGRGVAQQVPGRGRRVRLGDARAHDLTGAAAHDDRVGRHGEQLVTRRELPAPLRERRLLRADRAADERLPLRAEDVVRVGRALRGECLLPREQVVELRRRDRLPRARVDRRRDEVRLEIEQLELSGLADDLGGRGRVLDAGELDRDLVGALRPDLRLGDAELVDAGAHDRDRAVEVFLRELAVVRRNRLQRHLEAALEVEPERRRCSSGDPGIASSATPTRAAATSATTRTAALRVMCGRSG